MKKSWFIIHDGSYSVISNDPEDERRADEKFSTFSEAHRFLIRYFQQHIDIYKLSLREVKKLKRSDFGKDM